MLIYLLQQLVPCWLIHCNHWFHADISAARSGSKFDQFTEIAVFMRINTELQLVPCWIVNLNTNFLPCQYIFRATAGSLLLYYLQFLVPYSFICWSIYNDTQCQSLLILAGIYLPSNLSGDSMFISFLVLFSMIVTIVGRPSFEGSWSTKLDCQFCSISSEYLRNESSTWKSVEWFEIRRASIPNSFTKRIYVTFQRE